MSKAMLLVTLVVLLALAAPAFAASDITVTVTLGMAAVEVSPTMWPLGVVPPTVSKASWVSGQPGYFTATNTGNAEADVMIQASTTSPSVWAPNTTPAFNAYVIASGIGVSPYTSEPSYTVFQGPMLLAGNIAMAGTVEFDLQFTAPAADSTYSPEGETFSVTLSVTGSL